MKRNNPYPVGTPFWKYRLEKDEEEAMSELQEYIDVSTGICLTVVHDIPGYPKLTISNFRITVEDDSLEKVNEAIRRLLAQAGIQPEETVQS